MIFVFVNPGTQEAAGRVQYLGSFNSEQEADEFIEKETQKSKGWYSIHSYIKAKKIN